MSVVENAKEQLLSSGSWSVDPAHSTVEFRVKHMVIQTVRGRFRDFDGAIVAGNAPSISGSIRVASLETLHEERDAHLRSPDFFDAERHPTVSFTSTELRRNGDELVVEGELEIRGERRPVRLTGTIAGPVMDRIGISLETVIDRTDFGITWNMELPSGGAALENEVKLTADLELAKA
jgi:polyisoprenoid-binding protein YceI